MAKGKDEEKDVLQATLDRLNKAMGAGTVYEYKNFQGEEKERVSSGSLSIDYLCGGGYVKGLMHYISGGFSSGKSTLCLHAIKEVQRLGGKCAYVDSEYCITGDSLIYDPTTGVNTSCDELFKKGKEFNVLSHIDDKYVSQKAIIKHTGKKQVYQIKLESGSVLKITGNHEVLTQDGYKRVDKLTLQDVLYRPKEILCEGFEDTYTDKDLYYLLGMYLGDGSNLSSRVTPELPSVDLENMKHVENIVDKYGCDLVKINKYVHVIKTRDDLEFDFDKEDVLSKFNSGWSLGELAKYMSCGRETVKKYLHIFGIPSDYNFRKHSVNLRIYKRELFDTSNTESYKKDIVNPVRKLLLQYPETSLNHKNLKAPSISNEYNLANFLSGLIMADGTIVDYNLQKRRSLSISTSSYRFAVDLQTLFLRLGVQSGIASSKKDDYDLNYSVTVNGNANFKKLKDLLQLKSYKKERFELAQKSIINSGISYDKIKFEGTKRVLKIKSISLLEEEEDVYDISVKNPDYNSQNFLCNNVIIHNCLDASYAESIGVDMDELIVTQPNCIEDGYQIFIDLVNTGKVDLIIFDSIAAAQTKKELEGDVGDATMGIKAKLNSTTFPKICQALKRNNTIGIFINQQRMKMGVAYGSPITEPGGESVKFYPSIKLEVNQSTKQQDGDGSISGNLVKAKCVKNKTSRPFLEASYVINYGEGIDNVHEVFDLGQKFGYIKRGGAWFSYEETSLGQGEEKAIAMLRDNPDLVDILTEKIRTHF